MTEPAPSGALTTGAYRRILDQFQAPLYRFVRGLVGNGEEACDLVQDVFVDAWCAVKREAAPFTTEGTDRDIRNWLYHAAYCNAASVLRRRSVIAWESLDSFGLADALEQRAPQAFEDRVVESVALQAVLATLEPADVACLRLGVVEDFTSVEIAQILGIAPDAARKRLSRAMHRLRAAYYAQERIRQ
jgi:RNA polymerase sigma-70 factor, ECF subfamily